MYAIVEIAGNQYKVEENQEIFVNRLDKEEGAKIIFDKVLLIDNNGKIKIGTPTIKGAKVAAKIISHLKGDKVLVFHKKRRKGYQKLNGHRDYLTKLIIEKISMKAAAKPKKTEAKVEKVVETKENTIKE